MKKSICLVLTALVLVGFCFAGGQQEGSDDGELVVAFSQMEINNAWRVAETGSVKGEAEKRGIKLIYTDAQGDTAKQVSDVEDIIASNPDYILLAPREYDGIAPALEAAKEAGIPVILIDRDAAGVPGEDYVTCIRGDFVNAGRQDAELLAKHFDGKDANIVVITGTPGSSVAIDLQKGFEEEIAKYPNLNIIAVQNGEFTRGIAQAAMENVIQSYGDQIDAVFGHDDECAIGSIQALKAAGVNPGEDVVVVGFGGFKDAAKAILAGEMLGTIECTPYFGPISFDTIERLEAGEDIPVFIENKGREITIANAEAYMPEAF